jgi:cobalt-zinc-cadmium efflux system membrane fusion protein
VREGAPVAVAPAQQGDVHHADGRVIFVSPILNPDTRSARVIVVLPNKDLAWRPGTFVTAEVEVGQDEVEVRVPKSAVQTITGEKVVFVRTSDGFEKREIELGRSNDDSYEIVSGLKPGEEIAIANSFLLKAELGKAASGDDD